MINRHDMDDMKPKFSESSQKTDSIEIRDVEVAPGKYIQVVEVCCLVCGHMSTFGTDMGAAYMKCEHCGEYL